MANQVKKIYTELKLIDVQTEGGFPIESLTVFMGRTNVGKTIFKMDEKENKNGK